MQVVLLCFLCGWMVGWFWGSRSKMLHQKVSQWDRERGTGGSVWQGWNDKHNFRLKQCYLFDHILSKCARTTVRAFGFEPRLQNASCVFLDFLMLRQPAQLFPNLWLLSPVLKSCKVRQVSPMPTSGCVAALDLHLTSVLPFFPQILSECETKTQTILDFIAFHSNPAFYLIISLYSLPSSSSFVLLCI